MSSVKSAEIPWRNSSASESLDGPRTVGAHRYIRILSGVECTGVELSEFADFDLDRSTARAWSKFQARLADHVADMQDDDILLVEAESAADEDEADGSAPYVQFCAWGEEFVRCEVSSNDYLATEHLLDPAAVETLTALGWSAPTCGRDDDDPGEESANFYLDVDRSHVDRLAVMTVKALRDVFGVAHPVFLSAGNLTDDDEPAPDLGVPASQAISEPDPDELIAVSPRDREHLRALVDDALTPFFGHVPEHDDDGDIPVVSGSGLVFVRVLEGVPAIQMFAAPVVGVSDLERAAFEVAVLNRDIRFIKFLVVEDRVMAYLYIPAWPFAPQHLRTMLALMSETVDEVDDDLVVRVGGRRAFEAASRPEEEPGDEDESTLHPAMMTLLQLDAESPGSVDPELAASICANDRDLILELITCNSEQEIAWRKSRDEAILSGDLDDAADVCDHEMQHAERTTNLLRRALRVVVERELGRRPGEQAYDEPRRRRARKKTRPGPHQGTDDPSLEELDPDVWN